MTQAAQSRSCQWSVPACFVGWGRVCMTQKMLVGRCHVFADPWWMRKFWIRYRLIWVLKGWYVRTTGTLSTVLSPRSHPLRASWRRMVGALSCWREELEAFIDFVSNFHPALQFTSTITDTELPFLDINLHILMIRFKPLSSTRKQILKVISDRRSDFQFKQLEWKSLKKKSRLQRDSNPWPPRYRCDALPTELWSHTLGARSIVSSYFPVKGVKWRKVYEMIHIRTADVYEGDKWSSQWISNLSNWNEEVWKNQGFNYLHFSFFQPDHCKRAILYSQFLGLRRLCSDDDDLLVKSREMTSFFTQCGYPCTSLEHDLRRVTTIRWSSHTTPLTPKLNGI